MGCFQDSILFQRTRLRWCVRVEADEWSFSRMVLAFAISSLAVKNPVRLTGHADSEFSSVT